MIRDYKAREKQMSAGQSMMSVTSFQHQKRYNTTMNTTSLVELGQQDSASPERQESYTITSLKIKQEGELTLFKLRLSTLEAENAALRQKLEKVAFYETSLKKRNEEYESKRKEALKLTFEKRQVDKELSLAKHKIAQLNSDFEVIHAELDNFPSAVQSRFQETLREKDETIRELVKKLEESQDIITQRDAHIDHLANKLQTAKGLLVELRDNLQDAQRKIGELTDQGRQELELKKELALEVNNVLNKVAKRSELEKYIQDRVAIAIHPVLQENEQLKVRVEQLNIDLTQMSKEVAAEEDIHLKDELKLIAKQKMDQSPKNTKKFFTQGTLMLDCDKIFD